LTLVILLADDHYERNRDNSIGSLQNMKSYYPQTMTDSTERYSNECDRLKYSAMYYHFYLSGYTHGC
jgi:hypothetical protein